MEINYLVVPGSLVKSIYILGYQSKDISKLLKRSQVNVSIVWLGIFNGRPTAIAPRPVSFSGGVFVDEIIVLDGGASLPLTFIVAIGGYARRLATACASDNEKARVELNKAD
jgi:hypothetical protein